MRRLRTLGAVLGATLALAGCEEPASLPDGGDAAVRDAGVRVDAAQLDADTPEDAGARDGAAADAATTPCAGHHDCEQGAFCHRGACRRGDIATYHCGRPGCPPGRWCVESDGRRGVCAEDPAYGCADACDCGPAHCCVDGRCVADDGDPWRGGGGPSACPAGPEVPAGARLPTYCARDPECFAGAQAWAASGRRGTFLALSPDTGEATAECGAERCFGTACNCAPGESCVDTIHHAAAGATCDLDSGGTCVSNALAESIFGFAPSELLPCCEGGCLPGERCELGWMRSGNRFAYQRITAVCADPEECSCGDGTCCPSEIRSCPADCMPPRCEADGTCTPIACGDGRCDPFEDARRCSADCDAGCGDGTCSPLDGEDEASCATDCLERCGDGWCSAGELTDRGSCPEDCADRCSDASTYGRVYRVCGDGVCDRTSTCDYADVESCATCPEDCGACEWEWIRTRRERVVHGDLQDVWVVGADDVYVASDDGNVFHYDGAGWHPAAGAAGQTVWAAGPRDVFTAAVEVRYFDGSGWGNLVGAPEAIRALGGTRGDDLWALTALGLHHYDGHRWTRGPALSGEAWDVWAASETELFVTVDAAVLHFVDGRPTRVEPAGTWPLYSVSGASRSDVFVAGGSKRDLVGVVAHFDGSTWTDISPPGASVIFDVWAAGGGRAFAIDDAGALHRYDGGAWTTFLPARPFVGTAVHGSGPTDVYGVGSDDLLTAVVHHFDGASWNELPVTSAAGDWLAAGGSSLADLWLISKDGPFRYDGAELASVPLVPSRAGVYTSPSALLVRPTGEALVLGREVEPSPSFAEDFMLWRRSGGAWIASPAPLHDVRASLFAAGDGDVFLAGGTAGGAHFDGAIWSLLPFGSALGVWASGPGDVYFVGAGGVSRCASAPCDDAARFATTPVGVVLYAAWGAAPDDVVAVGGDGVVLESDGSGWSETRRGGPTLRAVGGRSSEEVFAVGEEGTLLARTPAGWVPAAADLRSSDMIRCPGLTTVARVGDDLVVVGGDGAILRLPPRP